jgi:hypothetical protein
LRSSYHAEENKHREAERQRVAKVKAAVSRVRGAAKMFFDNQRDQIALTLTQVIEVRSQ